MYNKSKIKKTAPVTVEFAIHKVMVGRKMFGVEN